MLSTSTSGLKLASTIHRNGMSVHALSTIKSPCANADRRMRLIETRVSPRGALTSVTVLNLRISEALRIPPLLFRPAPVPKSKRKDYRKQPPRDGRCVPHPNFHNPLEVDVVPQCRRRPRRS